MPRTVIAVVDDLFFASKIRGTAEQLGVAVKFARTADALAEAARRDLPALIICDLHSLKVNPNELAKYLKAHEQLRSIPFLDFFSPLHPHLQRKPNQTASSQTL